jgi:hypothetical protein
MADKEVIQGLVFEAIDGLNRTLPADERLEKRADLSLFAKGGKLDSLGIVDLLMIVEQCLADKMGVTVSLLSDQTASDGANPFATVASLVDYVALLIDQEMAT